MPACFLLNASCCSLLHAYCCYALHTRNEVKAKGDAREWIVARGNARDWIGARGNAHDWPGARGYVPCSTGAKFDVRHSAWATVYACHRAGATAHGSAWATGLSLSKDGLIPIRLHPPVQRKLSGHGWEARRQEEHEWAVRGWADEQRAAKWLASGFANLRYTVFPSQRTIPPKLLFGAKAWVTSSSHRNSVRPH